VGSNNKDALKTHLERKDVPWLMKIGTLLQSPLSHFDFLELAEVVHGFIPKDERTFTAQEQVLVKKFRGATSYRKNQLRNLSR
jgi:predicted ATPase